MGVLSLQKSSPPQEQGFRDGEVECGPYRWRVPLLERWASSGRYWQIFLASAMALSTLAFLGLLTASTHGLALPSGISQGGLGKALQFTRDGTFQISIFEDLHYGENAWDQWGPQQDIWSTYVMNQVLDTESPQLVVLNGDLITGENTFYSNSTDYVDEIVRPLIQRNLTWASTYGNHDSAFNLSRENILARERTYPNARTTQMVFGREAGVSNYYLPVYPSGKGTKTPCLLLWFFDSRGGFYYQEKNATGGLVGQPDWVDQSVVEWFTSTNAALTKQYGGPIPSLAFVYAMPLGERVTRDGHIPTNASQALQTEAGVDENYEPGINDDYILAQQAQGYCPDGTNDGSCGYGGQDVPFMKAIVSTPGLIGLFSGHDHGDTWCYKWNTTLPGMSVAGNGIKICFGQHSGYGGYGTWIRGARQILIREDGISDLDNLEAETWIRLESQSMVGAVTLNSTYGEDSYPATNDTHTYCPTCVY